jgi:hypothetical protein
MSTLAPVLTPSSIITFPKRRPLPLNISSAVCSPPSTALRVLLLDRTPSLGHQRGEQVTGPIINSKMAAAASRRKLKLTRAELHRNNKKAMKAICHNSKSSFGKLPPEVQLQIVRKVLGGPTMEGSVVSLLLVDGTVFFPAAYEYMYNGQMFRIDVCPKGVKFMNQPLVTRLESAHEHGRNFFCMDDSPFRADCVRKVELHIYAPEYPNNSKEDTQFAGMFRNISFLVDQFMTSLTTIHIVFKQAKTPIRQEEDGNPVQDLLLQLRPPPPIVREDHHHNTFWTSHKLGTRDYFPRSSQMPGISDLFLPQISNIELLLVPFLRLRNVKITVEFPELLRDCPVLQVLVYELQVELGGVGRGGGGGRTSAPSVEKCTVGLEGTILDRLEHAQYLMHALPEEDGWKMKVLTPLDDRFMLNGLEDSDDGEEDNDGASLFDNDSDSDDEDTRDDGDGENGTDSGTGTDNVVEVVDCVDDEDDTG